MIIILNDDDNYMYNTFIYFVLISTAHNWCFTMFVIRIHTSSN